VNLEVTEVPAGDGQLLVVYINPDLGVVVDPVTFSHEVSLDAAARLEGGWRLASLASWPIHVAGTTMSSPVYDTGNELTTQLAFVALYTK